MVEGYQGAANRKPRVLINSIMNASGKRGSRLGNALGVLGMYYTGMECIFDHLEVDQYLGGYDFTNPTLAAISTGVLFKSTAGPRVALMAGLVGAGMAGVSFAGSILLPVSCTCPEWDFLSGCWIVILDTSCP
ncbi:unnamed protein product [Discosporangium mesarthrocarpum]